MIVGSPYYDNDETAEGRGLLYRGSAAGLSLTPDWMAEGDQAYASFGVSVGTASDVNGDGYDDVMMPYYDNDQADEGSAQVYDGSASGLSITPSWVAEGNQAAAFFGASVGAAGDVNGDGYDDVNVGAPYADHGQDAEGRAYVYLGSATGLSATPSWTAESDQVGANLGASVGAAGDVNADGYEDVVVGAD